MQISCKIIQDLLPLYHDEVCSKDSRDLVDVHLSECDVCRNQLQGINDELSRLPKSADEARPIKAISDIWKKDKTKSFIKGTAIAIIICAVLVGAYFGLTQWRIMPVSTDVLEVSELSQLSDGSAVFHLFVNDNKNLYFIKFTTTEDGSFYFTPMRSIIESNRKYDLGAFDSHYGFCFPQDDSTKYPPQCVRLSPEITSVYLGPVGNGILLWEKGMELPPASPELEKMVR